MQSLWNFTPNVSVQAWVGVPVGTDPSVVAPDWTGDGQLLLPREQATTEAGVGGKWFVQRLVLQGNPLGYTSNTTPQSGSVTLGTYIRFAYIHGLVTRVQDQWYLVIDQSPQILIDPVTGVTTTEFVFLALGSVPLFPY
jgi:hypothetical protein